MNCIHRLPLKSVKLFSQHVKSFYAVSSQMSDSLSIVLQHQQYCNSKFILPSHRYKVVEFQKNQIRGSRYFRRRPIDVVERVEGKYMVDYVEEQEHQAGELHNDETEFPPQTHDENSPPPDEEKITKTKKVKKKKGKKNKMLEEEEEEKSPHYENVNKKDLVFKNLNIQYYNKAIPKVRRYLEEGKSTYAREGDNFFYVEGWRLLAESLNKGLKPLAIFFSRSRLFYNLIPTVAKTEEELTSLLNLYPLYKTSYDVFKMWSTLRTPPGVIGVFKMSEAEHTSVTSQKKNNEFSFPLTVILDEIRDPSNLGGIFRTLAAAGVQQIILMKGCCDIWDPKVFRATAGTQLNMSCLTKVPWNILESHVPPAPKVFLADSYCTRDFIEAVDEEMLNIEPANEREMNLLREESLRESEINLQTKTTREGYELEVNYSHDNPEHLQSFYNVVFPKISYENAEFFTDNNTLEGQNAVLIIGGEKGLSNNAKKFALETNAIQVAIPLLNRVESLNSSVATGILVYAAQRLYNSIKRKQNLQSIASGASVDK